jgi:hypothetical protein
LERMSRVCLPPCSRHSSAVSAVTISSRWTPMPSRGARGCVRRARSSEPRRRGNGRERQGTWSERENGPMGRFECAPSWNPHRGAITAKGSSTALLRSPAGACSGQPLPPRGHRPLDRPANAAACRLPGRGDDGRAGHRSGLRLRPPWWLWPRNGGHDGHGEDIDWPVDQSPRPRTQRAWHHPARQRKRQVWVGTAFVMRTSTRAAGKGNDAHAAAVADDRRA